MSFSDDIRQFALLHYIQPARDQKESTVRVRAGDIHRAMMLKNRMPLVCGALDAAKFLELANLRLESRTGPSQGSNAVWVFSLLSETKKVQEIQSRDVLLKDKQNADFLLKEYDRMMEYQKITIEGYDRYFNIYLAVVTTFIVLLVPLSQSSFLSSLSVIVNYILGGLVILGMANFVGLSFANSTSIQYEKAMRLIQDAFIEDDPRLKNYLYFRKYQVGVAGVSIRSLIIRGISSASPKSLLVFTNSLLISFLCMKIVVETGIVSIDLALQLVLGVVIFMISALIHLILSKLVYRVHGIG